MGTAIALMVTAILGALVAWIGKDRLEAKWKRSGYEAARIEQGRAAAAGLAELAASDKQIDADTHRKIIRIRSNLEAELADPTDRFDELVAEAKALRREME